LLTWQQVEFGQVQTWTLPPPPLFPHLLPPLFPTPSYHLSLDTTLYNKVYILHLSSLSPSHTVWNTQDDAEADSLLPPHSRACCCISKYIYSFYIPFTDILLCFACSPSPTTWFFSTLNMMSHHGEPTCLLPVSNNS
jgi:hypothetical protein